MVSKTHRLHAGQRILIACIRLYQRTLSGWTGQQCRFHPTCSQFAIDAISKHGILRGIYLGMGRISRCQPFYKGKFEDNVPLEFTWRAFFGYKDKQ